VRSSRTYTTAVGLSVVETSAARQTVVLSGTVGQMNAAFGVNLGHYQTADQEYRGREGFIHVPVKLANIVDFFGATNSASASAAGMTRTALRPWQVTASTVTSRGCNPFVVCGI
jgi:subtilase family serine protease